MKNFPRWTTTIAIVTILALTGCADREAVEEDGLADTTMMDTTAQDQQTTSAAVDTLTAELRGDTQVPGPGDPDGSGTAEVVLNTTDNTVCYDISVENIAEAGAAHIHTGAAGESGPPIVDFNVPANGLSGCVDADPATIAEIQASPSDYFVNVHNSEYGGGAIRGQLGS